MAFGKPFRMFALVLITANCAAVWDIFGAATSAARARSTIACQDGDPACDIDGVQNDQCVLELHACVGRVSDAPPAPPALAGTPALTGPGARRLIAGGFGPPDPAAGRGCATAGTIEIPLLRKPRNPDRPERSIKPSKGVAVFLKARRYRNQIVVRCVPCANRALGEPCVPLPCPRRRPTNLPFQLSLQVPLAQRGEHNGSDLDTGWTGATFNFPTLGGAKLVYCLDRCDGVTTQECIGTGQTGEGTPNTVSFGPPLPLLSASVPVCSVNRFQSPTISTTYDLRTGAGSGDINLFSDVYLTSNPQEVCPRCDAGPGATLGARGTCSATARNSGAPCTVEGIVDVAQGAGNQNYTLSNACIPQQSLLTGTLDIRIPLQTGEASGPNDCPDQNGAQLSANSCQGGACTEGSCTEAACIDRDSQGRCIGSNGGVSQACCANRTNTPCHPPTIVRQGRPAPNGGDAVYAGVFCIARTDSLLINTVAGLPGPGALLLPVKVTVLPEADQGSR